MTKDEKVMVSITIAAFFAALAIFAAVMSFIVR